MCFNMSTFEKGGWSKLFIVRVQKNISICNLGKAKT